MFTYRKNTEPVGPAAESFAAMERQHARNTKPPMPAKGPAPAAYAAPSPAPAAGDIIYGARPIAIFIFGDDSEQARRRVYHLAEHYMARKEAAGFMKLKGALCLSISRWKKFHGLD